MHHAQPALRERLLPQLATGRTLGAFALTEPGAGSHPLGIASKAMPTGDGWHLSGQKIWSGSAAWAGVINVFVQQRDTNGQPLGISGFVVEKGAPGLQQGPEALTMGMRSMVQNAVVLENVPVNEAQLLGQAGAGMTVAQDAMMYGRLAIAAASIGGMKRCAQLMLRYSSRRTVSTGRLLDNPVTRTRLDDLTHAIAALSNLVTLTGQRLDAGRPVPEELYAVCKILAPELYWQAADSLVQNLGGRAYIETNLAPQILRDSRILRIFEGPTEALAMYLGARVIHQPAGLSHFLAELGQSSLSATLQETAASITADYTSGHSPFTEEVTARRQASFSIGEVAAWTVLHAITEATDAAASVRDWTQQQLEQITANALAATTGATVSSVISLSEQIQTYQATIGEVDQTLAGVNTALDDWLSPPSANSRLANGLLANSHLDNSYLDNASEPASKKVPTDREQNIQSASPQPSSQQQKTIERWLAQWLSQRLSILLHEVEPNKALADYGVDSVMAVELAQDLEDFLSLSEPLEVTLAWSFPTLSALSQHLATISVPSALADKAGDGLLEEGQMVDDQTSDGVLAEHLSATEMRPSETVASKTLVRKPLVKQTLAKETLTEDPLPDELSFAETLAKLSDDEIAEALAAELAAVRGRQS
mgnify:CR=1 FL=1